MEIFHKGQWGTVCDDSWDINDAKVACQELGYKYAVRAIGGGDVPSGTGQVWLDNVLCSGTEKSLSQCSHRGWGTHDCSHSEDAGVECSLTGKVTQSLRNRIANYYLKRKAFYCRYDKTQV